MDNFFMNGLSVAIKMKQNENESLNNSKINQAISPDRNIKATN